MYPRYPIYIVSKGRFDKRLTANTLEAMGVKYFIVVSEFEFLEYDSKINHEYGTVLVLPYKYIEEYDTCDDIPLGEKGVGPGAARNFCWDHSISLGATSHWVMDDNIHNFYRYNNGKRTLTTNPSIFAAAEDFVDRYENVPVSGFTYRFFCVPRPTRPAFVPNTRIYSCLLIRNDCKFRWRGRYNEDTDLSLRVLKSGDCTIQFNAFLQGKSATQTISGGNTDEFYAHEGTLPKSQMLVDLHPDVTKLVTRYGRDHHHVNYEVFYGNKLIKKEGLVISDGNNEYGMVLKRVNKDGEIIE